MILLATVELLLARIRFNINFGAKLYRVTTTVRRRYNAVNSLKKIVTIDTLQLAHEGDVWGVFC